MATPVFNPATGITSYKERYNLDDLLGGEPVPSASAATAPAPAAAPAAAPAPARSAGMLPAPAAPAAPIGGWRWGFIPGTGYDDGGRQDWIWDAALPESQGYWNFNEGSGDYVAPPPAPTGELAFRSLGINEGTDMGSAWFDTGSGLQVNDPVAIHQAQIAEQAAADARLPNLSPFDNLDDIYPIIEQIQRGLGIRSVVRMIEIGKIHPAVAAQLGPYVAARQAEADDRRGFMSHVNDWVNTDITHLENIGESWQEDPERLFLGINNPLESWAWGELLDKDYDKNMNMYGGPSDATYQESAERGNDPGFRAWAQGAAETIGTAMAGAWAGGTAFGQTAAGQGAIGAARAGLAAANSGDKEAMRTAIVTALIQQGIDVSAPHVAKWINDAVAGMGGAADPVAEVGLSAQGMLADAGDATKKLQFADAGTSTFDVSAPLMPPAGATPMTGEYPMPAAIPTSTAEQAASTLGSPAFLPGYDVAYGGMLAAAALTPEQEAADAENLQTLESGDTPPAEPIVTSEDVQKYAKVAKSVYDLLNPDSPSGEGEAPAPADAPAAPAEDATEEDLVAYAEQLVTYANLDAAAMAEQGLTPGTPAYYEYVMTQMDAIINQVLEGVDVDAADLADQLRAKTAEEMKSLERALFVRGQMSQLMGSGTYVDPATGIDEEVIAPEGKQVNPGRAGYQRGLARSANALARLRGADARKYVGGMLDRDVDFYGMQGRADERSDLEEQYLLEDERKRRRGMFGMGY